MNRKAWSTFAIKSIDEDARIIQGIASTPSPDRANDIVEPMGAKFALPMPFLWQHDSEQPIGHVTAATPTHKGIPVTIQLAKIAEPGTLKDRLDEAWQSIKAGLVRGLSIGFRPTPGATERLDNGGLHFKQWDWYELSAVTIPCNVEANILAVKRAGTKVRPVVKFAEPEPESKVKTLVLDMAERVDDHEERLARLEGR